MPNQENNPRYSRCRKCDCIIINRGKGWYHTGIRLQPGHFAEPMAVTAR